MGLRHVAGTAGAENATWPHASIRRAPRSVANMLASGAHFGGLLVANCSVTVPGMEATVELQCWWGNLGNSCSERKGGEETGLSQPARVRGMPPESMSVASERDWKRTMLVCWLNTQVRFSCPGACWTASTARGYGLSATRTGYDSDPTTDTNNGLCRAFRQRW